MFCLRKSRSPRLKAWEKSQEYLENVKKKLPDSFRAKQLKAGGLEAGLVYKFETDFLKEPFMKAIRKVEKVRKK